MEEDYKGHTIKALARQLLEPRLWQPIPEILTREENGSGLRPIDWRKTVGIRGK